MSLTPCGGFSVFQNSLVKRACEAVGRNFESFESFSKFGRTLETLANA
jgi:hypothetical protein